MGAWAGWVGGWQLEVGQTCTAPARLLVGGQGVTHSCPRQLASPNSMAWLNTERCLPFKLTCPPSPALRPHHRSGRAIKTVHEAGDGFKLEKAPEDQPAANGVAH